MAKTTAPTPKSAETNGLGARPTEVAAKAAAVGKKVAGLRADLARAHDLAHQAQVREALTRSELTLALSEALKARAEALVASRRDAAGKYAVRAGRPPQPLSRTWQRVLLRMGVAGEVRLIQASGLWRGADESDIAAYVRRRADPAAAPRALFDQAWRLAACPEAAGSGRSPLVHYIVRGEAAGGAPHPLFDPTFYRARNAAELGAVSPLAHFVHAGAWQGRDPHRLFDLAHYLGQSPDLAADEDPVSHYLRQGWRDGRSPHPLFDPVWYRRQMPPQKTAGSGETPPLVHYVTEGWRAGLSPHPLFDSRWYIEQYEDIAAAGFEPLAHYLDSGAAEGRNPSPWFDTAHYVWPAAPGRWARPGPASRPRPIWRRARSWWARA
jgi:hypothetical protein